MTGWLAHLIMRAPMWFSYSRWWVRFEGEAIRWCSENHPSEWEVVA